MEIVRLSKDHRPVICIGDWLTTVVRMQAGDEATQKLWNDTYNCFDVTSGVGDLDKLFYLFLAQAKHVFSYLREAQTKGEVAYSEEITDQKTKQKTEHKIKKPYSEVTKQVEEFFIVLISIITETEDHNKTSDDKTTEEFIKALTKVLKHDGEFVELRLRLMQFLYNSLGPSSQFRYAIFMSILKYAATNRVFAQVVQYIDYIDSWLSVPRLSTMQKRTLFSLLATELKTLNKHKESYSFLLRLMNEFQGADVKELDEPSNVKAAITLAVDSVKLPNILYMDQILNLDAIKNLSKTGYQVVLDLLYIFLRGGKEDLGSFFEKNAEFCKEHELDYDACLRKWRLLSLAGCGTAEKDIPLSSISANSGLSPEEAEELVVQAIGQNVLDAKIDQINRVVLVRSAMKREFMEKDWETLQSRLVQWQNNIKYIQDVLATRRS